MLEGKRVQTRKCGCGVQPISPNVPTDYRTLLLLTVRFFLRIVTRGGGEPIDGGVQCSAGLIQCAGVL